MAKDSRAPPALPRWVPPTPVPPKAPLPPVPQHGVPRWPLPRAAAFGEVCGAAVTSHQHPGRGAVTRLRSFAAEPVKESAAHSTGWGEPGVAWALPGMGTSQGWGGGGKMGFRVVVFFLLLKHGRESEIPARCVGKLIFQITPRGGAEPAAPQISGILLCKAEPSGQGWSRMARPGLASIPLSITASEGILGTLLELGLFFSAVASCSAPAGAAPSASLPRTRRVPLWPGGAIHVVGKLRQGLDA